MLSRVADSCFWLSRYVERAENNARLLDVNMQMLLDSPSYDGGRINFWQPILATLEDQEIFTKVCGEEDIDQDSVMEFLTFEKRNPNSILSCISSARENARTVREQISSEMWEQLNTLYLYLKSPAARADFLGSPYAFYKRIIDGSHLFQGITDCTMSHSEAWQFIEVAKFLERADNTSRILDVKYHILLPSGQKVGGAVDLTQWMAVLSSCSAMEAYLKVYVGDVQPWNVAEFIILNEQFPRSIRYCVERVNRYLHQIGGSADGHYNNEVERLSGVFTSQLSYTTIDQIFAQGLHEFLDQTQLRLIEISAALTETYCVWLES